MALLDSTRSILVVIDFQGKLVHMVHRPAPVLESARRLLRLADLFAVPVVLTEQYPKGIGPTEESIRAIYDGLATPKYFLEKTAFGCCGDAGFETLLQQARPGLRPSQRQIVIAGIEAHVCVMQTVLELLASDHEVHLCWDAISGRGEDYCKHALARMAAAGATITNHESVAFEWARDKNHPQFKALSALMKEGQPQG
ncbi:MAG: isochorismatase family protein [Holophagaceae bacterium]|nr:isochorismatase family protein [Holophagaceae bacterium]